MTTGTIASAAELRTLIEFPPATLNPRQALDATGQRLNMLMFRALTQIDQNLEVQPDLARSWKSEEQGRKWTFQLSETAVDHDQKPILATDLKNCIESYLNGLPVSPLKASFPQWERAEAPHPQQLVVYLKSGDPFLLRNLSLIRFFRIQGKSEACPHLTGKEAVIGSGDYKMEKWILNPERSFRLLPIRPERPNLYFEFVKDETSRLLKLIKGDVDFLQNSFSPTKTDWIMRNHADRFYRVERNGINVSYLAFNLKDPILSQLKVREAIALAIDRELIIKNLMKNYGTLAGSFLSPSIPGSFQATYSYDPTRAETLLDEAGFPKGQDGIRFRLKYKSTPSKDGFETAQVFQSMLKKVGIQLDLEVVDQAVFFASVRKGYFQMYTSRWIGISDASIFNRTLNSAQADNRVRYQNAEVDRALADLTPENLLFVQKQMAKDLPYFPLWFWSNSIIMKKDVRGMDEKSLSLSGSFLPWRELKRESL